MKKIKIVVRKNEEKILPFVWLNGDDKKVLIEARLIGEEASLRIIGIFLGTGKESVVFNTNVIHQAINTKSLTLIRGVFKEKASFNNDGLVVIQKGAKGADGFFSSKILLFDDAIGRSMPSLEINENNIKAGHSANIGMSDENQLFYLRSRGISEKEAKRLIILGFFEPFIKMLPAYQQKLVESKLAHVVETNTE